MKNILLLYASMEGQTAKIAATLRDHLLEAGMKVTLANVTDAAAMRGIDPGTFDLLVFGASIHVGRIEKPMAEYINRHRDVIATKPRSLFIVLLSAASRDAAQREASLAQIRKNVAGQLQVEFDHMEMIAGALKYTRYNWFVRWMMKRIARKEGGSTDTSRDHEYTDWQQVAAYARRLAG